MNVTTGATLTGGSTVVLSPAGYQPGKSMFTAPGHSHLTPRTVQFTATAPVAGGKSLGVARTGIKVTRAERTADGDCCTVKDGAVIADLGFRWDLLQSESEADALIALVQGLVFTTQFTALVKQGILPSA